MDDLELHLGIDYTVHLARWTPKDPRNTLAQKLSMKQKLNLHLAPPDLYFKVPNVR